MPVDVHTHYLPDALVQALREREQAPRIVAVEGEERLIMPAGHLVFSRDYVDMDKRLSFMDEVGVDAQLLSLAGLFGIDSLPAAEAAPLCRLFNDDAATLMKSHPKRFGCVAALPFADMEAVLAEYRRAWTELGLIGAILPMNYFDSLESAQALRPLFDLADDLGGHLFLHPGPRPDQRRDLAGEMAPAHKDNLLERAALDVQHRVAQAMVTLLMTDFLDGYANLTLHAANLGGTLPAVVERMDHMTIVRAPNAPLPSSRLKRVMIDCSSLGTETIEFAAKFFGPEHIMLGTDCPIFRTDRTMAAIQATDLSAADKESMLHGNAARMLSKVWPELS